MPIPESQLETWSRQGAGVTAKNTHESIRRALAADEDSRLRDADFEVYLQGSYRNDTNTRGDSDVDLVAQLNSTFVSNTAELSFGEQSRYQRAFASASYGWPEFKADVAQSLRDYFGHANVAVGSNSIKVARGSNRLSADVVPCVQYRKYRRFNTEADSDYVEGVLFYNGLGEQVVNFPKPHYRNGVAKNGSGRTNGWFKPVVRVFKNARAYLLDRGELAAGVAPSYFLQCLLFNVPDEHFGGSYQDSYAAVLDWLNRQALSGFVCQNGEVPLFGASRQQWSVFNAQVTVRKLIDLWEDWYE
jgi:hypothetical protein